jgi:hypothetical protein
MKSVTITAPAVNGLKLLEAVKFDRHLCAILIATRTTARKYWTRSRRLICARTWLGPSWQSGKRSG